MSDNNVNVRRVSLEIVVKVMEDRKFLNEVLTDALNKYKYLEKNKRSYISRITRGVVERFIELDAYISAYSNTKPAKLNPNIRNVLRLAIYELKYFDSIPESATVNEYVKLSGKCAPSRLKGFVNGVLRSMIRDDFKKACLTKNESLSMPKWLYDKFQKEYGCADEICKAFLMPNLITIRANTTKCTADTLRDKLEKEGVKVTQIPDIEYGFYLENVDYLEKLDSFKEGLFYVQDLSSMMVGVKSGVKAGDTVIDVCAAPGGKSLHVAELLKVSEEKEYQNMEPELIHQGHVYSYDISDDKVNLIKENIDRAGLSNITASVKDATVFDERLKEKADIVIADLPCSGLGIIGKKPDIKSRINALDIESLATLQQNMLNVCKNYVKNKGRLIFSTCTISKVENQDNVRTFLDNNRNYKLIEEKQFMPCKEHDGFFISILQREE